MASRFDFQKWLMAFLLKSGGTMTGVINLDEIAKALTFGSANAYIQGETYLAQHVVRIKSEDEIFLAGNVDCAGQSVFRSFFKMAGTNDVLASFHADNRCVFKGNAIEVARLYGLQDEGNERLEISRAGDITMLDLKYLKPGSFTLGDRPVAGVAYSGHIIHLTYRAIDDTADRIQVCLRDAGGTYNWYDMAAGV